MMMKKNLTYLLLPLLCITVWAAPASTAADLTVTAAASSCESPEYAADKAVDGNMRTRWSSAFTDNEWITFAFEYPAVLYGIELLWERAFPQQYSVLVSADNTHWSSVYSTSSGHAGMHDIIFPAVTAQYVRIGITKRGTEWGNSLIEAVFKTVKNQPSMLDRMWQVQWRYDGNLSDTTQWLCVSSPPAASPTYRVPSLSLVPRIPDSTESGYVLYVSRRQFSYGKFTLQFEGQNLALEWVPDSVQAFARGKVISTHVDDVPEPPMHLAVMLRKGASPGVHAAFAVPVSSDRKDTFSVVREKDIFWFRHNDEKFFERGVNCVLPYDGSKGEKYDVRDKFNNNMQTWATVQWKRLQALNFNAVAGWSHDAAYRLHVPHTRVAGLSGGGRNRLVDVFSKEYAANLFFEAWNQVYPFAGEKGLIGWFANNELPWYGEYGWPTRPDQTLFDKYLALPANAPGKRRLIAFLKDYYAQDPSQLKNDWEEKPGSIRALFAARQLTPVTLNAKKAKLEWTGIVAEQYFALARAALQKYDPGSLFLGVRFAGCAPKPVLEVCSRFFDVCSLNYYRKDGIIDTDFLDNIYALVKKPIMITEFSFRAMENDSGDKNTRGADVTVQTQQDRADGYTRYCTAMAQLPYIIGWDWFQYFDQPPGGRFDGENSNYGILSIHDIIYTNLAWAIKKTNARVQQLHAGSKLRLPRSFDPDAWGELKEVQVPAAPPKVIFTGKDWLRLPVETRLFEPWLDSSSDTALKFDVSSRSLTLSYKSGSGYGCGININADLKENAKPDCIDVRGARAIAVTALVPAGTLFTVIINESGAQAPGQQYYVGHAGADGESFVSPQQKGTGKKTTYRIPLKTFELQRFWGNQRGKSVIDTQAIKQVCIGIPGSQGTGEIDIRKIRFEP